MAWQIRCCLAKRRKETDMDWIEIRDMLGLDITPDQLRKQAVGYEEYDNYIHGFSGVATTILSISDLHVPFQLDYELLENYRNVDILQINGDVVDCQAIVEKCESKEKLDEREIYWISFYNAVDSDNFYNIASGGDGGDTISGYNESQKRKLSKKLSKARKGKVNLGSSNGNSRKVICLNTMEIYDTIVEASQQTGINKDYIQQCCSEKSGLQTAGYINGERGIWKYYLLMIISL